jgi:hypothetical protein
MKKAIAAGLLAGSLALTPAMGEENHIPPIPEGKYMILVKPAGAGVWHEYDTDGDLVADYKTLRVFLGATKHGFGLSPPLMYFVDLNKNSLYDEDEIFIDEALDGINGNEVCKQTGEKPKGYSKAL